MGTMKRPAHVWISNAAFARATGIKKVCMVCGQPSNNADRMCPGKRAALVMAPE